MITLTEAQKFTLQQLSAAGDYPGAYLGLMLRPRKANMGPRALFIRRSLI